LGWEEIVLGKKGEWGNRVSYKALTNYKWLQLHGWGKKKKNKCEDVVGLKEEKEVHGYKIG